MTSNAARARATLRLVVALGALGWCRALPKALPQLVRVPTKVADGGFDLDLLHINDMHARYEETNKYSGSCSARDAEQGHCYGGHARVATVIKQARQREADGGTPVIVLNAGDTFQGTVYYSIFRWNISAHFVNLLGFDAITLGNHEFDDSIDGVVPYVARLKVPLVVANADFSAEPELARLDIAKSVVLERAGTRIGVIGYLTPETRSLASPRNVAFQDEVEALTAEAARLKREGVHVLIALGHSGYDRDKVIAARVPHLDLVIGGHSHSFLYTGTQPDVDVPVGLYPTWIEQSVAPGRKVPVLQAYAFTKYMGSLRLHFDKEGELTELSGGPILLNKDVKQDPETLAEVERWKSELAKSVLQPLGRTTVLLDGTATRREESNLGNLITDAFVDACARRWHSNTSWTDASIALVGGGSIRTSIDATSVNGTITVKDVMEVLPFDNLPVVLKLRGAVLLEALEHGVSEYVPGSAWRGAFLQVSGIQVRYDVSRPPGSRVVEALARCSECLVPRYAAVDPKQLYGVVVSSFVANGGDGFDMLVHNEGSEYLQDTDSITVQDYIRRQGVVHPAVEGRITFVTDADAAGRRSSPSSSSTTSSRGLAMMAVLLLMLLR